MKRIIRKTMTYAAVLMLSACQTVARETVEKETRMKIKRTDCALTMGREFPGARGTLTTDDDGNPVLTYDFSRGGRYVGVEIRLPAPGLKSFAVSFEAERNCRASLVILEPGNRLETRRQHYAAGAGEIVIDSRTQFIQSRAAVTGRGEAVLFRIEKSTNAPFSGRMIIKDIRYSAGAPASVVSDKPDPNAPVKELTVVPSLFHRSHGLEYPGARTMQLQVPEGIKLEYDFTHGGRYIGAELDLEYAGATRFEIIFDVPQRVKVFGRALFPGGFYETPAAYFEAGTELKFTIAANGPWRKVQGRAGLDGVLGDDIDRAMLCVEKAPGTPDVGSITYRKVIYYGAETPHGEKIAPASSLPSPVFLWDKDHVQQVKNGETKPGIPGWFAADVRFGGTDFSIDRNRLNPKAFSISAWIYVGKADSSFANETGTYRDIIRKTTVNSFAASTEFKFSLCKMVPELAFQDENGIWCGVMRYGKNFRSGNNGKEFKPIISLPRVRENEWTMVTGTFDAGTIRTYINDEFILESRYPGQRNMYFSTSPLKLGNLFGMVDNIAVYDKALKPGEVALRYRETQAQYAGKLVALTPRTREFLSTFDRDFKKLLPITKRYLEHLPEREQYDHTPAFTLGRVNGQIMILRDGRPETSFCVAPVNAWFPKGSEAVADFAAAGTPYVQTVSNINPKHGGWGDSLDFTYLEQNLETTMKYHPNCRVIIRVSLEPPAWWKAQHRDEADRTEGGKTSNMPSMSSTVWQQDAAKALQRLIEHFENHPVYGPRIAGYLLGGGRASEWYWYASRYGWIDYNPKNVQRFRRWLKKHYHGDVGKLRAAWNSDTVTFETAEIPSGRLRGTSEHGFFRDLKKAMPVADHLRYMSEVISGCISKMAAAARKSMKTPKLIGVFNGYSTWHDDLSNQGFLNFGRVLADPNIDFIASPVCYLNRRAGFAGDYMNGFTAGIRLHGKLYYDEADMRSCFCNDTNAYKTTTPEETRCVLWRSWGNAMTQGTTLWWLLLAGNNTFHDEKLISDIAEMSRLEQKIVTHDRRPVAEIAVFCDEESMCFVNSRQRVFHAFNREARERLAHIGAPMDFYLLSDIGNVNMPDYKIYVFLNAYYMTPEKRASIHKKLAKNNAIAVWCHAPGYLSPQGNLHSTMKELTGFRFGNISKVSRTPLVFTSAGKELLPDMAKENREEYTMSPLFFVKPDAEDTVLANIGKAPVLVKRQEVFGTSLFSAVPPTAALLRDLCRANGIHIYIGSNDVLRANAGVVMVHASSAGVKRINIPWQTPVWEVVSGRIFNNAGKIELPMKFGQTAIFIPASR